MSEEWSALLAELDGVDINRAERRDLLVLCAGEQVKFTTT